MTSLLYLSGGKGEVYLAKNNYEFLPCIATKQVFGPVILSFDYIFVLVRRVVVRLEWGELDVSAQA